MTRIEKAAEYARAAHESIDHRRKYTGEPYIVHPAEVARIVSSVTDDENMICAAWLHDVVEDTPITLSDIQTEFGDDVAHLVNGLTNVAQPEDGNRATRIAMDREHTAGTDSRTKTIKLADLISNLDGIVEENSEFAKTYLVEKEQLLSVLGDGHRDLVKRVQAIIEAERQKLARLD